MAFLELRPIRSMGHDVRAVSLQEGRWIRARLVFHHIDKTKVSYRLDSVLGVLGRHLAFVGQATGIGHHAHHKDVPKLF